MSAIVRWLAVAGAAVLAASAQTSVPPVLSVELDNAITQPGILRLIRQLVLYVYDWSGEKPTARAWTNTGTVSAEVTRTPGSPGHWNASVTYTVVEAAGAQPGTGTVALHLTIHGTTVLGWFDGRFRDLMLRGTVTAGLTWDLGDAQRGMLLWLPDPSRPVRAALLWGGDKHSALREDLQAFGAANDVAVVGMEGFSIGMEADGRRIEDDLRRLGAMSGHGELERAPILVHGPLHRRPDRLRVQCLEAGAGDRAYGVEGRQLSDVASFRPRARQSGGDLRGREGSGVPRGLHPPAV